MVADSQHTLTSPMKSSAWLLLACAIGLLISSCATGPEYTLGPDGKPIDRDGNHYNPYEPGTYEHFKAEKDYPKTKNIWKNEALLSQTNSSNSRLVLSRKLQRGFLMKGEEVVIDYPISSGKSGHSTPGGSFKVLEKTVTKASNLYGKVYDAEGNRVPGVEEPKDVPEGGSFVGAPMPYWMRLTNDGIGHHIGYVPRYPASHGCIRGPRAIMPTVFRKVRIGTPVIVE